MAPIYLDHNATTPLDPRVLDRMLPYFRERFGNPSSAHASGRYARRALEDARETVAQLLHAEPDEVIFTSGATEANNLALMGLSGQERGIAVASPIEHPSVVEPLGQLAKRGITTHWLAVDANGIVVEPAFAEALTPDVRLVAVMLANNETGAIQPIAKLAGLLAEQAPVHCDAVQAVGRAPVSFAGLGVTSMSLSAHKFHGPKGIGALLLRRKARLEPQLWGGHQQSGRRPGTEPVGLAVGLAAALELAHDEMAARWAHIEELRKAFLAALEPAAPWCLNGPAAGGIPHTLNISFLGCQADALLMNCDLAGIACSTGSACSSGSLLPSPVLQAMQVAPERLHSAMRFSLGHELSENEVREAARRIVGIVSRLRGKSETGQVF
jgi:cysteine desulfurase